ncbi:MAG: TatD family hydrolase [Patescibacteria group bacterium]
MFDTHAHLNFNAYKNDLEEVAKRALEKNITLINVGSQISTSRRAIEIADQHDKMFAAIGLHPIHLQDMTVEEEGVAFTTRKEEFDHSAYRELAYNKKVVAIGETGLDYFHVFDEDKREDIIEYQKKVFTQHIKLANEVNLPMIIHCRGTKEDISGAYHDLLNEIKKNLPVKRGVLHCYVGPVELVPEFVELGFYFGFNGVVTFDKTGKLEQIALTVPLERILTETDCPYLTPAPYRGKRNEPAYVEFVAQKLADIRKMPLEELIRVTDENARRLFKL